MMKFLIILSALLVTLNAFALQSEDSWNTTFVTCPNGLEAISEIQKIGNQLVNPISFLNPSPEVLDQGSALIMQNPAALNPSIGAAARIVGCFYYERAYTNPHSHDRAIGCAFTIKKIVDYSQFKGCGTSPSPCSPPPCAAPPMNCHYENFTHDAFGCPTGCGQLKCGSNS